MPVRFGLLQFVLLWLVAAMPCYAQSPELAAIEKQIKNSDFTNAGFALKAVDPGKLDTGGKALYFYLSAKISEAKNDDVTAYRKYLNAKSLYLKAGDKAMGMDVNLDLAYLVFSIEETKNDYRRYLDEYIQYARQENNPVKLARGYELDAVFDMESGEYQKSREGFRQARVLNNSKDKPLEININHNLSVLYNEYLQKPDSALYYLDKNLELMRLNQSSPRELCYNYINQAASWYYLGNYKKAISLLRKADSIPMEHSSLKTKESIYLYLSINYNEAKDYRNAYNYLDLAKQTGDSINSEEQSIAINDIQTKYHTKEKDLENQAYKRKIKTNRILLYTFSGLLLATVFIGFLIVKNARKREKISKQEKLIEQQKLEKALKEYELSSIDLMLEGQEKERERIANDLHDNLGSMLAALKLNFENLKLRKNELAAEENKLYERTDELIEEAYQKVRRMAHAKNAGVLANDGLLPAIKKLAEKLSISGKLQMHVVDFGFDSRLENTLEIAIFRMVQELATNIIKHSKATEATIHLTHHDDVINIIIEDNGVGFVHDATARDGMGISSIQKKVSQLGGSFTVDSMPGKGTTILIDLPV